MERASQAATIVIGIVVGVTALKLMESVAAPVLLAIVFTIVLSPLSNQMERIGLPPVAGALFGLFLTLLFIGTLVLSFQPVVARLVEAAPKVWSDVQGMIALVRGLADGLREVTTDIAGAAVSQVAAEEVADSPMPMPSATDALLLAPGIAAQILLFAGTLFFFMLTRADVYDWAARRLSAPSNRAITANRLRDAERSVSRYFLTITFINATLGVVVGIGLHLVGLPGAPQWGLLVFVLNFVPYLGPATAALALTFAGVAVFDGGASLVPLLVYVGLNLLEGQFLTPQLVGRSTRLNPLVVFLALVFGVWLWGAIGGIVAIPLLVWVLVVRNGLAAQPATAAQAA
ncbi:MAG: AI-2E family transporter [Gemmobacter sp.]